ncbi:MAG: DUF2934 domain-containing protein [Candidatus Omnitrophica bacterium]|nr:DUF2934 domain-containing protein [Candidatus Omnitrophota bacterium]
MSKHTHLKSIAEQIADKGHGCAPFHSGDRQANDSMETGDIQTKAGIDNASIQLRAYQIYNEKGGYALDNWLEAERILNNIDDTALSFINEGNPNTQK